MFLFPFFCVVHGKIQKKPRCSLIINWKLILVSGRNPNVRTLYKASFFFCENQCQSLYSKYKYHIYLDQFVFLLLIIIFSETIFKVASRQNTSCQTLERAKRDIPLSLLTRTVSLLLSRGFLFIFLLKRSLVLKRSWMELYPCLYKAIHSLRSSILNGWNTVYFVCGRDYE